MYDVAHCPCTGAHASHAFANDHLIEFVGDRCSSPPNLPYPTITATLPPVKLVLFAYFTATSCLGRDPGVTLNVLRGQRNGLTPCAFPHIDLDMWIGEVPGVGAAPVRADLAGFGCRNNKLVQIGLTQDSFAESVRAAKTRHSAGRVGVFTDTSTSGTLETECARQ